MRCCSNMAGGDEKNRDNGVHWNVENDDGICFIIYDAYTTSIS